MHRSLGRAINARPIATICCSPPDKVPANWREPLLDAREKREDARQILVELGAAPPRIGAHFEVLVDRHARKQAARFEHRGDAAPHPFGGADARSDLPS